MIKRFTCTALMTLALAAPAAAQDDGAFVTFKVLKPEVALEMAQAAMAHCRAGGYQVGVTVVDRFGVPPVFLRDRFAGIHVFETARRKAWTAVSFRTSTLELSKLTAEGEMSAIRDLDTALALGGGLPIEAGEGGIVAGIGVSGAPAPSEDEVCAAAGIAAIEDLIAF